MLIHNRCTTCQRRIDETEITRCRSCGSRIHRDCVEYERDFECTSTATDPEIALFEF